ncbi:hypothetical protein DERP_006281 [Dermatophagoides pteronyssinus]|uniref:Uncharacterized protein n=1 Tax=Dermatophagoides pteronyssinus TaxID=6956 RepID=A0ABQ8IY08_DERPT|nr:hypothetical protein DERP_006281 [Dermatophagoides pteronyssinus]
MFRKFLIFLFFLVLVTAKRFGVSMINDINYGQRRWEKRNNKTMLPVGGINADGPYGRYRRPRAINLDDNFDNDKNNLKQQSEMIEKKSLMKMLKQQRQQENNQKFDDFWSTDSDDVMDDLDNRSITDSIKTTNGTMLSKRSSWSSYSYSTPSYTTRSYSTNPHYDWYWRNRMDQQHSMNDLSNVNSSSMINNNNFSNQNESFSMPNLTNVY